MGRRDEFDEWVKCRTEGRARVYLFLGKALAVVP